MATESNYVFLKNVNSDYPIGNFVKLSKTKLILARGIKTKSSSPVMWNLNKASIQPIYIARPYNDLIGCTGIGYLYFSETSSYHILTMWRHSNYFELFINSTTIDGVVGPGTNYQFSFYAGGGFI